MEKFNFFKKTEKENPSSKKETNNNLLIKLEDKVSFVKENNIGNFEDWSKKTFEEKMSILIKLDAIPGNFDHFEDRYIENSKNKIKEDFNKNKENAIQKLDRCYDFFMRVIQYPNYKEQSKLLYPEESKNFADNRSGSELKKLYEYSEHKYPEELLNLKPEVLKCLEKENKKNEGIYNMLSILGSLKRNGVTRLSDWYNKKIDDKRKILSSSEYFMGGKNAISMGNKIQSILKFGKDKYEAYLDQCFYSTIYYLSEILYLQNQRINQILNKERLLEISIENLDKKAEGIFKEAENVFLKKVKEIENDMYLDILKYIDEIKIDLPNLDEENKTHFKEYLELSYLEDVLRWHDDIFVDLKNKIENRVKELRKKFEQEDNIQFEVNFDKNGLKIINTEEKIGKEK